MRQLLRMWKLFAGMDLLWVLRGPRDAAMYVLSDAVLIVASISTTFLLAVRFDGIGHWDRAQILFMLGYAMFVNSLLDTLFGYNVKMISRRIGRGQLDHMLVQPQPLWRMFLTEGFTPFGQPFGLIISIAMLSWTSSLLDRPFSVVWLGILLLNLFASAAIVLALQVAWGAIAFWAPRSAEEINSATNRVVGSLGPLPLDGVNRFLLGGLLTVIPVGFTAWLPARSIADVSPLFPGGLVAPLAAPLFAAAAYFVFRKGLQHYARVGSQRYSNFGHRR
ncbi:ABC-2 family transporter protein [Tenggerimyces flavus]|uniref:ABC-2 family transporter protein n=1 Tax=Tenggerimyces flavus TaxID=1708749 RepID=A0ABV7YL06_9ACTN|nr:ABC-2 family transporter protein [Tenggerimyces flavus]MBM7784196.1 ABC-2 type transport system permease protein [Tenggerimyces flavus]